MVANGNNGNLPYDIMINILKRLPVKSLIRFKCVSKDWSHLFQTPHFTSQHLHHSSHNNPFLLLQRIPHSSSCLIGPDLKVHNPQFIDFPNSPPAKIIGSCNGLLCCVTHDHTMLSILNPAAKEVRQVLIDDIKSFYYFGFGFSPVINDYKIVRISISEFDDQIVDLDNLSVSRAEVYSLTTGGSWKEIDASNLQNLCLMSNSVTANGVIFWQATSDPEPELVASFDIGREIFTLLKGPPPPPLPSSPNTRSRGNVLAVYNNKLAMFHHFIIGSFESSSIDLWVLEEESWVKQYTIGPFLRILYPLSIWRDEIVCREELPPVNIDDEYNGVETVLSLFNPYNNELKKLPAQRDQHYYVSFNFAESLVPVGNIHHQH